MNKKSYNEVSKLSCLKKVYNEKVLLISAVEKSSS